MRNFGILSMILGTVLIVSSCNQTSNNNVDSSKDLNEETYREGKAIVKQNCISCHAANKEVVNQIGPTLLVIKKAYLTEGIKEAEFVNQMTEFLLTPGIENTSMPDTAQKYGVMPNLGMAREQYEAVATYLFRTEMEKPNWYEEDFLQENPGIATKEADANPDYLKKGMNIALAAKAVLGKNLLSAIQAEGTTHALAFCNERAIPLTDSMALDLSARIKRVSDQNRNPDNSANDLELAYIHQAKVEIQNNGTALPQLQEIENQMVGYYPIMTNNMCLQCHGKPSVDITAKTLGMIAEKYPEDKATGYSENELRGIWVITMDK